jgi:trk system potassium uptake protein TrkA
MNKLGATETIFPERDSAQRLATRIVSSAILNYVRLGTGFSIQEMAVPDRWIGRCLLDLQLPERHRISVIAVHDVLTDVMAPVPDPSAPLKESDTLLVAGRDEDLARAANLK